MRELEPWLERLLAPVVAELASDETAGIALTGSFARGEASHQSDIDINHFVHTAVVPLDERYRLRQSEERLIAVTTQTLADARDDLKRPDRAIWTVSPFRQLVILHDPMGAIAGLQLEAAQFGWASLEDEANRFVSRQLAGLTEEVHKLVGGLARGETSAQLYALWGMCLGMAQAMAVERRVLIRSENSYLRQVVEAMDHPDGWREAFEVACGWDGSQREPVSLERRAEAALTLYRLSVETAGTILLEEDRVVIESALQLIAASSSLFNR